MSLHNPPRSRQPFHISIIFTRQSIAYEFNKGEHSEKIDASKQAELKKRFEEKMEEIVAEF